MRTRTIVVVAVALVAAVAGGVAFVALSGGDGERRAGALTSPDTFTKWYAWKLVVGDSSVPVRSLDCGYVAATPPADRLSKPGPPNYSACTFATPVGSYPALWSWVSAHLTGTTSPAQKLQFVAFDRQGQPASAINLANATIARFRLSALHAESEDEVEARFTLNATDVTTGAASSVGSSPPGGVPANGFELTIDGLSTQDVFEIAPWGFDYDPQAGPKISDLSLTLFEQPANVAAFDKLLRDTAINQVQPKPRTARLVLKPAASETPVLTLRFTGVSIVGGSLHGLGENPAPAQRQYDFSVGGAQLN